jgi:hypothetical protein
MGIKDKFSKKSKSDKLTTDTVKKERHTEYQEDKKQVVGHSKRIKNLWRSKEVVQLKTEAIMVLWKEKRYETQFF